MHILGRENKSIYNVDLTGGQIKVKYKDGHTEILDMEEASKKGLKVEWQDDNGVYANVVMFLGGKQECTGMMIVKERAIEWAVKNGIMNGFLEDGITYYRLDEKLTRAQAFTFLWRVAGKPEPSKESYGKFNDVSSDAWYATPVAWGLEKGIIRGTGNGNFSPDGDCSMQEFFMFLYRYIYGNDSGKAKTWGQSFVEENIKQRFMENTKFRFSDEDKEATGIMVWLYEYADILRESKFFNGRDFSKPITRAETIEILYRYMQNSKEYYEKIID